MSKKNGESKQEQSGARRGAQRAGGQAARFGADLRKTQRRKPSPAKGQYSKPGPMGGRLIREVISFLRSQNVTLPISSHILIAVSGGPDSTALAHLLVHYGRRVGVRSKIMLLHVNHGWRGEASTSDARFVQLQGRRWGVPVKIINLRPPSKSSHAGESWEDLARRERAKIFAEVAKERKAVVLTAHHAEDLAETVLWRLFTGAARTHGGGIAAVHHEKLRPLLRVRKRDLAEYLREENQDWREDATNFEGRFMRSRMRQQLMPLIEELFPRAIEHLARLALDAQGRQKSSAMSSERESALGGSPELLFEAAGLRPRRIHFNKLDPALIDSDWAGELHLSGGWRLVREKTKGRKTLRWVLEKL